MLSRFFIIIFFLIGYQTLNEARWGRAVDVEDRLKPAEFKLIGLTHLLRGAETEPPQREKKREVKSMKLVLIAVNLDVLNVTLLIPVPKVQKKEMKGIM